MLKQLFPLYWKIFSITRRRHWNKLSPVSKLQMKTSLSKKTLWHGRQLQLLWSSGKGQASHNSSNECQYRPFVKHCLQVCLPPSNERHCNWIQWILKHSHHSGDLPICLSRVPQDSDHTNLICSCHSMSLTHSALNAILHLHITQVFIRH